MEDLRRRHCDEDHGDHATSSSIRRGRKRSSYPSGPDVEHAGTRTRGLPRVRGTETMEDEQETATTEERETIPPRRDSPVNIISALSFVITAVIIGMMVYWKEGVALIAVGVVSLATSIVSYPSWWHPILLVRARRDGMSAGDVAGQIQHGGFIVVQCSDDVARELYAGTPECWYQVGDKTHKLLMALGTAMLIVAIILLGSISFQE